MCFTSPMKFTKSILRPVRATTKGGAASLAFLSRRFRTSGGRRPSTFFTITGKKRGGAPETHEPSSPKVTCIGQVRVKSKKRVKQCRRRIGEVSFRMAEPSYGSGGGGQRIEDADKVWIRRQRFSNSGSQSHRDQRWVHLPVSVCAALRAFKAEICCFFPCKCCCFPTRVKEGNTKSGCYPDENGCGAVFPRWLVAVNGGEGRKRREIEVVVAGEERSEMMSLRSSRRHVFDGFEVKDLVGEEGGARVSICIPPKNALLLMRCKSDPMKMAALENAARKHENGDIEEDNDGKEESVIISEEKEQEIEENDEEEVDEFGDVTEQEKPTVLSESIESCERVEKEREEEKEEKELSEDKTQINSEPEKNIQHEEEITHSERERPIQEEEETQIHSERESTINEGEVEKPVMAIINQDIKKENKSGGGLPECLLLMMCEPKLSMEVSKETWVRGTDFIRLLPERPRKPPRTAAAGETGDQEPVKRRPSIDSKSKPRVPAPPSKKNDHQPARSSCSLPAASTAAVIERNQVNAGKCEPYALTRCKSEPMSTAAAKLMPESC